MLIRVFFITLLFCATLTNAQELKRRASHGVTLRLVDSAIAKQLKMDKAEGMLVQYIFPNSNAAKAGLQNNDVIISINNVLMNDFSALSDMKVKIIEGDQIIYKIFRQGKEIEMILQAIGKPKEQEEGLEFEYGQFSFDQGLIRTIITADKDAKKKPAILFVPGFTCFSQDNMGVNHPYKKLVYHLAKKGFLVMRAEKPGMGDSNNKQKCVDIDFDTEVASYREALKALYKHPKVDANNVFIFGHSLGGMEAPFIAEDFNVKGIITMGITIKHWREYLTEMLRNQIPRLGENYVQAEKDLKLYEVLLYELLVNNKTPSEMILKNEEYGRILQRDFGLVNSDNFLGRNIRFSQSLNNKNCIEAWLKTEAKILSVWGDSDIQVINDFSHRELVDIVNKNNPNNATFLELKGTDHNFLKIGSLEESYRINRGGNIAALLPTHFDYDAIDKIVKWINNTVSIKD